MALNDNDLLLVNDSQDSNKAKKIKYSTLKSNINGDDGNDLQAVTDNGNTTTKGASFADGRVAINTAANGDAGQEYFKVTDTANWNISIGNDRAADGTVLTRGVLGPTTSAAGTTSWGIGINGTTAGHASRATAAVHNNRITIGTDPFGSPNITLNADGSSSFSGNITANDGITFTESTPNAQTAWNIDSGGDGTYKHLIFVPSQDPSDKPGVLFFKKGVGNVDNNTDVYIGGDLANSTPAPNTALNADGSASFAGNNFFFNLQGNTSWGKDIKYAAAGGGGVYLTPNAGGGSLTIYKTTKGTTVSETDSFLRCYSAADDSTAKNEVITLRADGSANFIGTVTAPGLFFNLEPDNPTNFNAEGEYTGPTLDIKAVIQELQQRVADRDAVITNLTTRIAALEADHQTLMNNNNGGY